MDSKQAFLNSASTLIRGLIELMSYRIVGNTTLMVIHEAQGLDISSYPQQEFPIIKEIKSINQREFRIFSKIYHESTVVLAYSLVEAFLDEVEEALLIHNPSNVGENISITLGKILAADSLENLYHDIIKKKIRDKGQWSLQNRLKDLADKYTLNLSVSEKDIKWMTDLRNAIIHERKGGNYKVIKKKVNYEFCKATYQCGNKDVSVVLSVVSKISTDLYNLACTELKITRHIKQHKLNLSIIETMNGALNKVNSP